MKGFIKYIKHPIPVENTERFTLKVFSKTIGLSYFLFFVLSAFLVVFKYLNLLPNYPKPEVDSISVFLMITVLGPLFEEILCRLNLKISKLNIAAFVVVLIMLIIKLFFVRGVKFQFYLYLGGLLFFALIYCTIILYDFPLQKIETYWKSNFKNIFHLSAITFGILHLNNFEAIYWWMIVISPLLTAPYIALGYILGYIRMKYGFAYGWLIHTTINFISVMLTIHKGILLVFMIAFIITITYYFLEKRKKHILT